MSARVLILTASYGQGHNTAARNLNDAFHDLGIDSEVQDMLDPVYPFLNPILKRLYALAITRLPRLWELFYRILDNTQLARECIVNRRDLDRPLRELIDRQQPNIICSTYMIYNYSLNRIYPNPEDRDYLQATIVTDSLTINRVWFETHADNWYVANPETKAILVREGLAPERIFDLGFPVSLKFDQPDRFSDKPSAAPEAPRILYIVNADHVDPIRVARTLLTQRDYRLTMTLGNNLKLKEQLEEKFHDEIASGRLTLHGWSNEIPELMMAHQVVISKAGGATTQEAIAARTPMLVTHIVPGQEEGNFLFLKKYGVGFHTPDAPSVIETLDQLFENSGEAYTRAVTQITALARKEPARSIARHLLDHINTRDKMEGRAPSLP